MCIVATSAFTPGPRKPNLALAKPLGAQPMPAAVWGVAQPFFASLPGPPRFAHAPFVLTDASITAHLASDYMRGAVVVLIARFPRPMTVADAARRGRQIVLADTVSTAGL